MKYSFIQHQEGRFSVASFCRTLRVSRSGYSAGKKRSLSLRSRQEPTLLVEIRADHQGSRGTYGSPRIDQELRGNGVACSRNRVARVMRKYEITARPMRRYGTPTDSNPPLPIAPNRRVQEFTAERPNTHGSADMTYLWTGEGWLYLAVVLDLYSRRGVGRSIQDTLGRSIVLTALESALQQRKPEAGLICHSDRGSQYASGDYPACLSGAGALCCMSRKGHGYAAIDFDRVHQWVHGGCRFRQLDVHPSAGRDRRA